MNPRSSALGPCRPRICICSKVTHLFALFKDYSDLCIVIDKVLTL